MNWGSAANFFAMGGYAFYVWGAYGVTILFLFLEIALLLLRKRTIAQRLGRRIRMRIEVKNEAQT
ncbi:MAG: heme exporter protein CcmD [Gammaproteobacteria bacterium]|jgi:heme exporter protein D